MQHDLAAFIAEQAGNFGEDVRLYENYSGRGMLGDTTTGIVMSSPQAFVTLVLCMNEAIHQAVEDGVIGLYEFDQIRWDSLGLDWIIY